MKHRGERPLRRKAARRKQGLNQAIPGELAAVTVRHEPGADFSDLAGKWSPDPGFDEILAAQRQIDRDKWIR